MQRFSKKRQAILDCLQSTTSHPTADWIYSKLKPVYPDLSLATVYRNLSQLEEAGLIRTVGIFEGEAHFDGNLMHHAHLRCKSCGKLIDMESPMTEELLTAAEKATGYSIQTVSLVFSGLCPDCQKNAK